MTADVELLPCPFCGSENIDPKGWASTNSAGPACDDCGASAGGVSGTLQDNIARWNTRTNVAHAIAAKDAEIEALRAQLDEQCRLHAIGMERELALITERDRLRVELGCLQQQYDERTACMIVHRGSALACSAAVRAAYSDEHHRAERLAEALRYAVKQVPELATVPGIAAALEQGNDDA